jgi:plasmid stabilization system protein ParE
VDRILDSAERLGLFPHLGHTGHAPGTLEWVVPGLPYIIVYRISEDEDVIDVIAILHGAQERKS